MLRTRSKDSPLWSHTVEHHPEAEPDYHMRIERVHKSALSRQVHEGLLISGFQGIALNRKGEWGQKLTSRLVLEDQANRTNTKSTRLGDRRPAKRIR